MKHKYCVVAAKKRYDTEANMCCGWRKANHLYSSYVISPLTSSPVQVTTWPC